MNGPQGHFLPLMNALRKEKRRESLEYIENGLFSWTSTTFSETVLLEPPDMYQRFRDQPNPFHVYISPLYRCFVVFAVSHIFNSQRGLQKLL